MVKKRLGVMAVAGVCSAGLLFGQSAFAAEMNAPIHSQIGGEKEKEVVKSDYVRFSGSIVNAANENGGLVLEIQGAEKDDKMFFPISDSALLFDGSTAGMIAKDKLEKGQEVVAYVHKDKPAPLIYPPVISPDVLVVKDASNKMRAVVAKFDDQLLSLEKQLKLNIGPETEIIDNSGEKLVEEDIHDKEALVFFSASTKSIPEQTVPAKVVVLEKAENGTPENNDKVQAIVDKDHYLKNGEKMIPIREVADALGYKVEWEAARKIVTLRKENSSVTLTIGEQDFGYNRSRQRLQNTPDLYKGKTYVPEEILDTLYLQ